MAIFFLVLDLSLWPVQCLVEVEIPFPVAIWIDVCLIANVML